MKRAVLLLSDTLMMDFLKKGLSKERKITHISKNSLPKDVEVVRVGHNEDGVLRVLLQSEEFENVPKGVIYPELPDIEITSEVPVDVTDEEREAITRAIEIIDNFYNDLGDSGEGVMDVLKSLVERLERG